jgi:hypothetical protein
MTLEPVLRAHLLRERVRACWATVSRTVFGDILATAVAIGGIGLLFLACAFGVVALTRACGVALRLMGAG